MFGNDTCVLVYCMSCSTLREEEEEDGGEMEREEEKEQYFAPRVSLSQQLSKGFIPDAEFIHRARKQREEKRQMGGDNTPSFVPLSKKKVPMAKGKSRLVREDENDQSDSGGEEGTRRQMDVGCHDTAAAKQLKVVMQLYLTDTCTYMYTNCSL